MYLSHGRDGVIFENTSLLTDMRSRRLQFYLLFHMDAQLGLSPQRKNKDWGFKS